MKLMFAMRFCSALLAGLMFVAPATAGSCAFAYNNHVKYQIVLPALKAAGESSLAFDLDKPFISATGDRIVLLLNFREPAMDAPSFGIELEPCTLKVLKTFRAGMLAPPHR